MFGTGSGFPENKVAKDMIYIETGEKYSGDARMIDDMVTEFSNFPGVVSSVPEHYEGN